MADMNTDLSPEVNVSVTFRHTESTDALKEYATSKVTHAVEKYIISPANAHVILSVQKRDHSAEVRLNSKRFEIDAEETTEDLYSAIDKMVDNITRQLRKQKERRVNHKSPSLGESLAS